MDSTVHTFDEYFKIECLVSSFGEKCVTYRETLHTFPSHFGLPVYTIAGATLMGTFVTSIAGVAFYVGIAPFFAETGLAIAPDWTLGALFGAGGFLGIYCGARLQKYLPAKIIKIILILTMTFIAIRYIANIF